MSNCRRALAAAIGAMAFSTASAFAQPSQDEVFNSIRSHVTDSGGGGNGGMIVLLLAGGIALLGIFAYFSRREVKAAKPMAFNHPGKLLKELVRDAGLKPGDVKHLKLVAEQLDEKHQIKLKSALTLMLCPSVLTRASKRQQAKA